MIRRSTTIRQYIPPSVEPITLDEAKLHCRITHTAEDAYVSALITASRQYVESVTGLRLIEQTLDEFFECFPHSIDLVLGATPVQSVVAIEYTTSEGLTFPFSGDWTLIGSSTDDTVGDLMPAIRLNYAKIWPPMVLATAEPVKVRYVAGYGDATKVPSSIKQAMLLMVSHWYVHREAVNIGERGQARSDVLPLAVHSLLDQYRRF